MVDRLDPLIRNRALVNSNGTPTTEFTIKWEALTRLLEESAQLSYIPLVSGAEPPEFITDGAGRLILTPYP